MHYTSEVQDDMCMNIKQKATYSAAMHLFNLYVLHVQARMNSLENMICCILRSNLNIQ